MIEWGMLVNNVEISFCSGGLIIFFFGFITILVFVYWRAIGYLVIAYTF